MSRIRRASAAVAAILVVVLVPLVVPSAADAADPCLSETPEPPGLTGCDDAAPPETGAVSVSPSQNPAGYVRASTVTFAFAGAHSDGDADPIGFECMLYNTASPPSESDPASWESCTSPKTYPDLAQSAATAYTFKVRAVDTADRARIALDANPLSAPDPDLPDHDVSPASLTFRVDTVAPNTFITHGPVDNIRPDWPVTETASPQLVLNSNEASTYQCTLNGAAVGCAEGVVTLRNLSGGSKTFVARAVDTAGNLDPTPSTTRFFVPSDLEKSRRSGWKRVKAGGYFGGDYLSATKVGATLKVKGQRNVREVRLLAPAGPRLGKLQVRVGDSQWYTVNLHAKSSVRQKTYLVRSHFTPLQSGTIQIRVKTLPNGGSVAVDALVARN